MIMKKDCKMLRKLYDNQIEISDQYRNEILQLKKELTNKDKQSSRWYDKFQKQKNITKELKEMLSEAKERIKELERDNLILDLTKSNLDEPLRSFEKFIEVPDIRNKLGSIVTLIELIEDKCSDKKLISTCIKRSKKAVNYLAQREVFIHHGS